MVTFAETRPIETRLRLDPELMAGAGPIYRKYEKATRKIWDPKQLDYDRDRRAHRQHSLDPGAVEGGELDEGRFDRGLVAGVTGRSAITRSIRAVGSRSANPCTRD